jgi:hypothetical protein
MPDKGDEGWAAPAFPSQAGIRYVFFPEGLQSLKKTLRGF